SGSESFGQGPATVGRITAAGVITQFPLPKADADPEGIAAGPDGNLWVAERHANAIARVTSDGVLTEFRLPRPKSGPLRIAAGSDGDLWFTDAGEAPPMLGRITPGGVISELALPSGTGVTAIAPRPDGNIWFPAGYGVARASVAQPGIAY